jgi:hypothetical protein
MILQMAVSQAQFQARSLTCLGNFVQLFNLLFDEHKDLKLSTINTVEARTLNWNKINATICFNYL